MDQDTAHETWTDTQVNWWSRVVGRAGERQGETGRVERGVQGDHMPGSEFTLALAGCVTSETDSPSWGNFTFSF